MTFRAASGPEPGKALSRSPVRLFSSIPLRSTRPRARSAWPSSPRRAPMILSASFSWASSWSCSEALTLPASMARIWNSRPDSPDFWTVLLPRPTVCSRSRTWPSVVGALVMIRRSVPSPKSTPSLRPLKTVTLRTPARTMAAVTARATYLYFRNRMWGVLKSCMLDTQGLGGLGDRQIEEEMGDEDGREQVGDEADGQGHGVAADRPGAELEEEDGRDDRRQVGVEDGREGPGEALRDRAHDALAEGEL